MLNEIQSHMQNKMKIFKQVIIASTLLIFLFESVCCSSVNQNKNHSTKPATLDKWQPKQGSTKPVIAVVGDNYMTEITDYVLPYGILKESGVADVWALGLQSDEIHLFPALKMKPQSTTAEFDNRYSKGADFVIVPAVHRIDNADLIKWIQGQSAKGATIVGVCDGVWVVANAGLLKSKEATGFWYSLDSLQNQFSETHWIRDRRYVQDGNVITTTGVTASINISLALIEAIAGPDKAMMMANRIGTTSWGPTHNSNDYQFSMKHYLVAAKNKIAFWSHDDVGISINNGVDEIALALLADVNSRTFKSQAYSVSDGPTEIQTRNGLTIIPDKFSSDAKKMDRMISLSDLNSSMSPIARLNHSLEELTKEYGQSTAEFVRLQIEYDR